jgi:hypothetical protein
LTPDSDVRTGWYVVNLGLNGEKTAITIGSQDSKYPLDYAFRSPIKNELLEQQRIVGVHGYTRLANGELRSLGFIVAHIDI